MYEIYPHKRNQGSRTHLEHLLDEYPDDFLFVVRDKAFQHVTDQIPFDPYSDSLT